MTKPRLPQKFPTSGSCNLVWGGSTQNCIPWKENMLKQMPIAFVTRPINENNLGRNKRPTRSLGTLETTGFELERGRKHNPSQHRDIMTRLDWCGPRSGVSRAITKQRPHSLLSPHAMHKLSGAKSQHEASNFLLQAHLRGIWVPWA